MLFVVVFGWRRVATNDSLPPVCVVEVEGSGSVLVFVDDDVVRPVFLCTLL